jgi:beta-lactamase superfamily II metal-dependent hydrolase
MAQKSTTLQKGKVRVRMYRIGFGDCFLLSVPNGSSHSHILVDCGVHARGDIKTMKDAIADIAKETDRKLAIVIATHAHQDHISGFGAFGAEFEKFDIGEIWMPWLMDDRNKQASKLAKKQFALAQALQSHFAATGVSQEIENVLVNATGVSTLGASATGPNATALKLLRNGFGSGTVRYFKAGDEIAKAGGVKGLTATVLAPSTDETFLASMDPPPAQRYRIAGGDSAFANAIQPFSDYWSDQTQFPSGFAPLIPADAKKLADAVAAPLDAFAFALDKVLNNTSLVVLFRIGEEALLFPGDAQWGNWKSWLDTEGKDVLQNVTFYKVAHHGSWNATPKPALEGMQSKKFAAMASTQSSPWPSIPEPKLVDALKALSSGFIESDSLTIKAAPKAPKGPVVKRLPKNFRQGELWYDYLA